MNFCGGSWYGVFVVNITGIEGGMAVEGVAAMFVWSGLNLKSRPLSLKKNNAQGTVGPVFRIHRMQSKTCRFDSIACARV